MPEIPGKPLPTSQRPARPWRFFALGALTTLFALAIGGTIMWALFREQSREIGQQQNAYTEDESHRQNTIAVENQAVDALLESMAVAPAKPRRGPPALAPSRAGQQPGIDKKPGVGKKPDGGEKPGVDKKPNGAGEAPPNAGVATERRIAKPPGIQAEAMRVLREAARNGDYSLMVPWLRDGTLAQIRTTLPEDEPKKMGPKAPMPIRAIALVHAPAETVYRCVFDMADWPRFVPRVKKMRVTAHDRDANRFFTDVELAMPFVGNARFREEYTGVPDKRVTGRILSGDYDGWLDWRLHPVGDGEWTILEHESRVVLKQFLVRAVVRTDKYLESAINQSAVTVRLEAIKRKAEYLARKAREERGKPPGGRPDEPPPPRDKKSDEF